MLAVIVAALLALGIVSSPDQATQDHYNNNKSAVDAYIIDTDIDVM
jgi:hypothetical protein